MTFNPDERFPERLAAVAVHVARLVVVDNGSSPRSVEVLARACRECGAELLAGPENAGVAAALNRGVARARENGVPWVLAMDQDSVALPVLMEAFREAWDAFPARERLAVIGANYFDDARGKSRRGGGPGRTWREETTVITSGSLLSVPAWETVGPFRDDFFIDHVDDEYCLRARARGYRVILATRPALRHSIGSARATTLLGRRVWTSNHSAARRYYMARNFTVLSREYVATRPGWILGRMFRHLAFALLMVLLEDDRARKVRGLAAGLADGVRGRMGKLPPGRVRGVA